MNDTIKKEGPIFYKQINKTKLYNSLIESIYYLKNNSNIIDILSENDIENIINILSEKDNSQLDKTLFPDCHIIHKFKFETVREAMQIIGTQIFRRYLGEDVFIKKLFSKFQTNLIIPDVRLLNEAHYVRSRNGIIIKVRRPNLNKKNDNHITEQINISPDIIINNVYDIDYLYKSINYVFY
jgi:hypothetical protein